MLLFNFMQHIKELKLIVFLVVVTEMAEGLPEDGGLAHKEPGHRKMPARVHDGEWNEAMTNMEAPGHHDFKLDPSMGVKPPKKKRVSKKKREKSLKSNLL
ncbi:hypothetical protein OS493_027439 [Desmophyllum pertusum]|uniref:Uncharacterized protein n=1 Tax=Desmophyllum pertusum TaxID=174260 RepID=A0A9W9YNZ0_9CNID|nr:hypothetical protein OS493_027439 [Desmophyllum pertusum]